MMTMDIPTQANILGFLALITYILTLLPSILRIVFPQTKATGIPQFLSKHRRIIGLLAFFLTLDHASIMVRKRNFDFFDVTTFSVYIQGVSTFIIFALLAITSNNWSVKKLKKNWKELHKLTYFAMLILIWHIWDKMSGHWTYLTPVGLVAVTGTTVLFLIRLWIERQSKSQKTSKKESQPSKQKVTK